MSIAGGIYRAVERAVEVDCNVLQVFVKNSNRWKGKELTQEDVLQFRQARDQAELHSVVAHDSYLINLASPNRELWRKSILALLDEMDRSERLGLDYLVTHPGAHTGAGEEEGIRRIVDAIDRIHDEIGDVEVRIALETTAGQGTTLGYDFSHFRDILAGVRDPGRLAICVDTCHLFAAGYEIRSKDDYDKTLTEFDRRVGLGKVKVLHFNDSKKRLGSRVDRHEHIGEGEIGLDGFRWFVNDIRFHDVPKILETPKGKDGRADRKNLSSLRELIV